MKNLLIYLLFIACGCLFLYSQRPIKATGSPVQPTKEVKVPMSIRQLQTFLNEQGHSRYKCEIDGKMGKETIRAWDNYIMDRYANQWSRNESHNTSEM